MENEKRTNEITIGTLVRVLKQSLVLMIVAAIIIGSAAALFVMLAVKPTYRATASFWVRNYTTKNDYTTSALTGASASIADTCLELASQDMPIRQAVQDYDLVTALEFENEDDCVRAIQRTVSAKKESTDSFMFYITVETDSPETTYTVINALQYTMPEVLQELLWGDLADLRNEVLQVVSPVASTNDVTEVKPSPLTTFVLAAAFAAVVVYAIAFIIAISDKGVNDENTLKNNFSEPIVGVIPASGNSKASLRLLRSTKDRELVRNYEDKLLSARSDKAILEAFNTLKTNLAFYTTKEKTPVLAITSGYSGEGKSLTCANLAISLASSSKKVLLVECDMRMPSFGQLLGIKAETGLSELLAGIGSDTSSVVCRAKNARFDVIACGKIPPNPTELLSSERMRELVAEWRNNYDYVILDMPPVGEVVDATVVSGIVDGYLVTVRSRYSDTVELSDTLEKLKTVNGSVLGFILNDVQIKQDKRKLTPAAVK